jgi:hypothetical protein
MWTNNSLSFPGQENILHLVVEAEMVECLGLPQIAHFEVQVPDHTLFGFEVKHLHVNGRLFNQPIEDGHRYISKL